MTNTTRDELHTRYYKLKSAMADPEADVTAAAEFRAFNTAHPEIEQGIIAEQREFSERVTGAPPRKMTEWGAAKQRK